MLVLSRGREEKVIIQTPQGDVVITVLAFRGDSSVKLGFTAPRDVLIHRSEILEPRRDGCRSWCSPMTRIDLDPAPEADRT